MRIRIDVRNSLEFEGHRVLHVAEGGYAHELGAPAVHPAINALSIQFTAEMQRLSYRINNGRITPTQWTRIYGNTTALCNNQGFGGSPPRRNYITGEDMDSAYLPKLLKAIIFSGTFIRGLRGNGLLTCIPGIHGIDVNKPLPTAAEVLERNWYTYAVSAGMNSASHFVAGTPTIIPYFLRETVAYPIEWFTPWKADTLPDPLKFYL